MLLVLSDGLSSSSSSSSPISLALFPFPPSHSSLPSSLSMRASASLSLRAFRSLSFPSHLSLPISRLQTARHLPLSASATSVEHLEREGPDSQPHDSFHGSEASSAFDTALTDLGSLPHPPSCEVKQLEDLPEQWRRSRLAWLCKELPSHKPASIIRILNGQRKWMTQEDATYVVVHCLRIRENETSFRVCLERTLSVCVYASMTLFFFFLRKERKQLLFWLMLHCFDDWHNTHYGKFLPLNCIGFIDSNEVYRVRAQVVGAFLHLS